MKQVLTCEHAGNIIPLKFKKLFKEAEEILETHRGYDPGAYDLYSRLKSLASFARAHKESRLLIELNRSLHHPALFSKFTTGIPQELKDELIETYYLPYRCEIENVISNYIKKGEEVVHLSIHSFTPELQGEVRNADIGLLYDPSRKMEKDWCKALKKVILKRDSTLRIRFNYPYRGQADGFTTYLRKKFPTNYRGIEIEINQKFVCENKMPETLKATFFSAINEMMNFE